ncbi:MAG: gamma-glutamylcyclotransferase family protein [Planctomycetota bacterium]
MPPDLYFAYGSNMDPAQMLGRCPGSRLVGIGCLRDHRLVFNRKGSYRPGAVASVVPAAASTVYGVLWHMAPGEIAVMDRIEDPSAYRRTTASVQGPDDHAVAALMYVAIPEENPPPPDPDYARILLRAGRIAGLPEAYLREVEVAAGLDDADS